MRTVAALFIVFMIGIVPAHAILPTSLSIEGSTLGVGNSTGPLITGVLSTSTGFPLSERIIFFEASANGEFPGTSTFIVGKAVTNNNGEVRFRPSSFAQGPYFRATYAGDGNYAGTKSDVIDISDLLEEAKAARVQDGPGNMHVISTPSNADVYIDGVLAGKTDAIIKGIPPGEHDVTFVLGGYLDSTYSVLITSKKTVSLVVALHPPAAPLDPFLASIQNQNLDLIAAITGGPASYQLYQNTSDPASIPHSVNVIEFSEPSITSYLVVVSPPY
jgi:hypothetical protein